MQINEYPDEVQTDCHLVPWLLDGTNYYELGALSIVTILSTILLVKIMDRSHKIKFIYMVNKNEKKELSYLYNLMIIILIIQIISYMVSIVNVFIIANLDQESLWVIITILQVYYFLNLTYVAIYFFLLWQSSLIWLNLVNHKLFHKSSNVLAFVQKYKIIEIVISSITLVNYVLFSLCDVIGNHHQIFSSLFAVLSMIILVIFAIVAFLFRKVILSQREIPSSSRKRINQSLIGLIFAVLVRFVTNIIYTQSSILEDIKQFDDKTHKDDGPGWAIQLFLYSFVSNVVPIYLFQRIYKPQVRQQQNNQTSSNEPLNTSY